MKRILTLVVAVLLIGSAAAFAFPIDCTGVVNPSLNDSWSAATASGIARYTFYFENDPAVTVQALSLRFESDVFNLAVLDAGDFTVVNPGTWGAAYSRTSADGAEWYLTSGAPINAAQGPIIVDVNYSLVDANRMFAASGDGWNWDEGQVWGQSFALVGPLNCQTMDFPYGGGSTNAVPEPATLSLLGLGLAGVLVRRKK